MPTPICLETKVPSLKCLSTKKGPDQHVFHALVAFSSIIKIRSLKMLKLQIALSQGTTQHCCSNTSTQQQASPITQTSVPILDPNGSRSAEAHDVSSVRVYSVLRMWKRGGSLLQQCGVVPCDSAICSFNILIFLIFMMEMRATSAWNTWPFAVHKLFNPLAPEFSLKF